MSQGQVCILLDSICFSVGPDLLGKEEMALSSLQPYHPGGWTKNERLFS